MSSDDFLDKKLNKRIDFKIQGLLNRTGIDRKTQSEVFDLSTLYTLEKLISDKKILSFDFPISTGKEGNVFRALDGEKNFIAIKIYRTNTATFKNISKYIIGDPRFSKIHKTRRDIIFAWAKKEFKNLERLESAKIKAPKPISILNNVLIMEYLGTKEQPAQLLKDVALEYPKKTYNTIIKFIQKMYKKAELVHCDLSPYNILIHNKEPYIIDLGQALLTEHENAKEYLIRDIRNIVQYFKKYDIIQDSQEIFNDIIKKN